MTAPLSMTIVTITKDDLQGLRATLESTRRLRTQLGVTQIVIDGSTGSAQTQAHSLCLEENVRYESHRAQGIANAFNRGIELCQTEWIWHLNSADRVREDFPIEHLRLHLLNTRAPLVIYDVVLDRGFRDRRPPPHLMWPPVRTWVPQCSTLLKRELFTQLGQFDESYAISMDGEFWMRLFSRQDVSPDLVEIPLVAFALAGQSSRKGATSKEVLRWIWKHRWGFVKRGYQRTKMTCGLIFHSVREILTS